jgi:hypothetical protein
MEVEIVFIARFARNGLSGIAADFSSAELRIPAQEVAKASVIWLL